MEIRTWKKLERILMKQADQLEEILVQLCQKRFNQVCIE
jgi:hypothetical protein